MYSNGESEVILGKAIKKLNLPRDEIVVMTKVGTCGCVESAPYFGWFQVYNVVGRTPSEKIFKSAVHPDQLGYVNQRGLSRKVKEFVVRLG